MNADNVTKGTCMWFLGEIEAVIKLSYHSQRAYIKLSFASVLLLGVLISISDQFAIHYNASAVHIALNKLRVRADTERKLLAVQDFSKLPLDLHKAGFNTFSQHCRDEIDCSTKSRKYRTADGTCNNLYNLNSLYGSVGTPLERFLPAAYSDYISEPRKYGKNGDLLNPARHISEKVMLDIEIMNDKMTTMMVYFGELLVHDFVQTDIIKCKREQENAITSFIDASFLYGSNVKKARSLRWNGKLRYDGSNDASMLPVDKVDGCKFESKNCNFIAGDSRVNDNAGVAILHTVFLRAHNNIIDQFRTLKPKWTHAKRFHETRKIIGAILQSITYREYVPLVVGTAAMSKYDLTVGNVPNSTMYNTTINPAIRNSFTTAAFRFRHATIPTDTEMFFNDGTTRRFPTQQSFLGPFQIYRSKLFDGISRGMTKQSPRKTSVFMASSVTRQWDNFRGQQTFGSDLGATNIQRGRDHGLPPWNEFRHFCGFSKYNRFKEIPDIGPTTLLNLKRSYKHVDDIDLYVGGLLERPVAGGATGETFACLNAQQFKFLKNGDRFFYTNGATLDKMKGFGFSSAQIKELNKASLARLFCDFTGIQEIQPRVLEKADPCSNAVVKCDQIPEVHISVLSHYDEGN
ncbi:Chorion peroxidase [Nymphon striatum]|nr:Chorion peroxidase [Nymphon striatum]